MRMKKVTKDKLEAMDRDSIRCAAELADEPVDVVGYASAIMSMGRGYHRQSEAQLQNALVKESRPISVVTSAGALVGELKRSGVRTITIVTPYLESLTALMVDYIRHEGIAVVDSIALSIADNVAVGARDPSLLLEDVGRINTTDVDAMVLSACVQMPSLAAIQKVEDKLGLPGHLGSHLHDSKIVDCPRTRTSRSGCRVLPLAEKFFGGCAIRVGRVASGMTATSRRADGHSPCRPYLVFGLEENNNGYERYGSRKIRF
jgi:maleate isomerase